MEKLLLTILLLLISANCFAGAGIMGSLANSSVTGGTANLELGYTTIGSSSNSSAGGRGIELIVPAGGIIASHGYVYCNDGGGSASLQMAIYDSGGTQVGACSTAVDVSNTSAWNEVTWVSPISLSAGTYTVQYHPTVASVVYFYNATGTGNLFDTAACGTVYTQSSGNKATITVANYAAH